MSTEPNSFIRNSRKTERRVCDRVHSTVSEERQTHYDVTCDQSLFSGPLVIDFILLKTPAISRDREMARASLHRKKYGVGNPNKVYGVEMPRKGY